MDHFFHNYLSLLPIFQTAICQFSTNYGRHIYVTRLKVAPNMADPVKKKKKTVSGHNRHSSCLFGVKDKRHNKSLIGQTYIN